MTNSFRAAYRSWDWTNNLSTFQSTTAQNFDYEEFPLEQFYNLVLETTQDFQISSLEQQTTIGIEINKNPLTIFAQERDFLSATVSAINTDLLPSPYLVADLISKKNYLGLFIEHQTSLSDRLSINFEGTLDIAIADTTDLPEISLVETIENYNFYPEIGLDYQLSDRMMMFASFEYAAEAVTGTDAENRPLQSEVYQGIELGIETELSNNWLATVSFTRESQNNMTTIDPNNSDFDLQIDRQISQSWTGELRGEITPNWWLYGFYIYTDAQVIADRDIPIGNLVAGVARHRGGFWTSYQISQGTWGGLGFGVGMVINSDRPGNAQNSFYFPSCLQTDLAIFYTQNDFKAAISLQNLFDAGIEDEEITPQTIFSTILWEF